jgi:phosphoglycolate phosphatase
MIKGLIFDLDGTILDTLQDLVDATNHMLKVIGKEPLGSKQCMAFIGWGVEVLILGALDGFNIPYEEAYKIFNDYYTVHQMDATKPYPNIVATLKSFKENGYLLAVNSNKPNDRVQSLCELFFPNIFDVISGDDFIHPNKPSKARMEIILKQLNLNNNEVIYVGDTEIDYEAGKNALVPTVLVTWGFRSYEKLKSLNNEYLISNITDLIDIAKK